MNAVSPHPPFATVERPEPETPYQRAAQVWDDRIGSARVQAKNWRLIALFELAIVAVHGSRRLGLVWQSTHGTIVTPWVVQVDKLGQAQADRARRPPTTQPSDPQDCLVSCALHRRGAFGRCRPIRSSCGRTGCSAYDFTTDLGLPGAQRLCAAPTTPSPSSASIQIAIDVSLA